MYSVWLVLYGSILKNRVILRVYKYFIFIHSFFM
uniref:Uncharacterized protein n=1 Tax=Myoviridae sp. ctdNl2 TaxID=2825140 RepID=A0A8S5QHJ7_9CAUD|nr:MAG TPA: hypothetical protein [Myoviridae sp. ctdNl2]